MRARSWCQRNWQTGSSPSCYFISSWFSLCRNINVSHLLSTNCMQDVWCTLSHSVFTTGLQYRCYLFPFRRWGDRGSGPQSTEGGGSAGTSPEEFPSPFPPWEIVELSHVWSLILQAQRWTSEESLVSSNRVLLMIEWWRLWLYWPWKLPIFLCLEL